MHILIGFIILGAVISLSLFLFQFAVGAVIGVVVLVGSGFVWIAQKVTGKHGD